MENEDSKLTGKHKVSSLDKTSWLLNRIIKAGVTCTSKTILVRDLKDAVGTVAKKLVTDHIQKQNAWRDQVLLTTHQIRLVIRCHHR